MAGRRKWFQIHLSTCVVLMFASGVLVWLNVRITQRVSASGYSSMRAGFPNSFFSYAPPRNHAVYDFIEGQNVLTSSFRDLRLNGKPTPFIQEYEKWEFNYLGINAICAVFILSLMVLNLECLIRAREWCRRAEPRRWFPLHLATVATLVFAACGLFFLNQYPRHLQEENENPFTERVETVDYYSEGWPLTHIRYIGNDASRIIGLDKSLLVYNILISISILTATGLFLERHFIRRRERKQQEQSA